MCGSRLARSLTYPEPDQVCSVEVATARRDRSMYKAKAYASPGATSPLTATSIERRDPKKTDVQIEIQFCGICHSDVHQARNEWSGVMPTVYPLSLFFFCCCCCFV